MRLSYILDTAGVRLELYLQVLGSVARNIDLFREQYVETTLEMHGTLLSLMHLRRSDPDVYKIITQQQRKCAAKRKVRAFWSRIDI